MSGASSCRHCACACVCELKVLVLLLGDRALWLCGHSFFVVEGPHTPAVPVALRPLPVEAGAPGGGRTARRGEGTVPRADLLTGTGTKWAPSDGPPRPPGVHRHTVHRDAPQWQGGPGASWLLTHSVVVRPLSLSLHLSTRLVPAVSTGNSTNEEIPDDVRHSRKFLMHSCRYLSCETLESTLHKQTFCRTFREPRVMDTTPGCTTHGLRCRGSNRQ